MGLRQRQAKLGVIWWKSSKFIILLMLLEGDSEQISGPFDIIHNARSSRASRSRKSSISVIDKDLPRTKTKKMRKMTLNPQSIGYRQIRQIEELHLEKTAAHSQRAEEVSVDDFLELGWPRKMQSEKQQELQRAIGVGLGCERDLDSDFQLGRTVEWMDEEFEMRE